MSITGRIAKPAGIVALAASALLFGAPAASAHNGEHHPPSDGSGIEKGDPQAGTDFFAKHLDTYHWGNRLVGFDNAVDNPYRWFNYHFVPTGLEVAARTVSPEEAPEAEGDTWKEKKAPESDKGSGHDGGHGGPPSHDGEPLRAPVNPAAGAEYLQKYSSNADPSTAVPAGQEALRRTVTPTEQAPPVKDENWSDKRPAEGDSGAPVILPGDAASVPANASKTAGKIGTGVLDTVGGEGEDVLPTDGLVPGK